MNILKNGVKTKIAAAALICASITSFSLHADSSEVLSTSGWEDWQDNQGFNEALEELGMNYNNVINPVYTSEYDTRNVNSPLFWLNRTLTIYRDSEQGHYQIPVSEVHADGRARTAGKGRHSYFLTHTWGKKDESVTLRLGDVPQNVFCSASIDPNYEHLVGPIDTVVLNANGETTYTFSQDALLVVGCQDQTKKMENVDQFVSVDVIEGGTYHPLFIFGLHDKAEWKRQAEAATPSGYHLCLMDGYALLPIKALRKHQQIIIFCRRSVSRYSVRLLTTNLTAWMAHHGYINQVAV